MSNEITNTKRYVHKNLTGTAECPLIYANKEHDIFITGLTICNTHAQDSTYVDLYLKKTKYSYHIPGTDGNWDTIPDTVTTLYIMKDIEITANNTLVLEPREIDYNAQEFDLMLQLNGSSSAVDVIVNYVQENNNKMI
jgi:hypothetical protein